MVRMTLIVGLLLVALGVYSYVTATPKSGPAVEAVESEAAAEGGEATASGKPSVTTLIPAFVGGLIVAGGLAALVPGWRKHAMHVVMLFALIGTLGGLGMGLPKLASALRGEAERPRAVYAQVAMGVPCAVLLVSGIGSFVAARRQRDAVAEGSGDEAA
ncbi:hypothetical protein [Mucisphaera calidilacus]|uniref:Uncharacterized protein n=1 Tax=Mucisphaera calidilacus TaxID=2527982 RepID=A0A518BYB5_9BACT|nr:hypothetical protein [Mucisphaera calidilacus]QDU71967.1 hypothetical protein Pan265_18260 [Mucisphaera calidilacus]